MNGNINEAIKNLQKSLLLNHSNKEAYNCLLDIFKT